MVSDSGVSTAEKRQQALELRRQRKSAREIGEIMGISHTYALRLVNQALTRIAEETKETTERYRALQTLRLEELLDAWAIPALDAKDDKAATVYLRILDQLSRLYALYPQGDAASTQGTTINISYTNDNRQITVGDKPTPGIVVSRDTGTAMLSTGDTENED